MSNLSSKLFSLLTVSLISLQVYAGGSNELPRQVDGVVSCTGEAGEIRFHVFKKDYKGEILSLSKAIRGANFASVRLTDKAVLNKAIQTEIVAPITKVLDLHVNLNSNLLKPVAGLSGSTHEMIPTAVAPFKTFAPVTTNFINVSIEELNDLTYLVSFKKIQAGQKVCTRTEELPNPYKPGTTFTSCVETRDVAEQKVVASFKTVLNLNSCSLL